VRWGLSGLEKATTRAKLEAVLEGCRPYYIYEKLRQFQLVVSPSDNKRGEGVELRCEKLRLEGWDISCSKGKQETRPGVENLEQG